MIGQLPGIVMNLELEYFICVDDRLDHGDSRIPLISGSKYIGYEIPTHNYDSIIFNERNERNRILIKNGNITTSYYKDRFITLEENREIKINELI